ncbi:putative rna polymerase ii transcription elongation factor [Phaeomoniella chlamydospora]|uniref:Putative rna polymerase ii transcription elongation factor n=1 Tax=Phaeomoniella chlamydospora TaxID=158046 RepID=A0A0G2F0J1_PHACM|nr:putative rna polymerase ii transcription elongation factor [Phaeomoniella chlamydospora]
MAPIPTGYTNGAGLANGSTNLTRFSDIPSAIDIPVSGADTEEAVEVNLEELLEDSTELCQLLENENAAKNYWIIIALAYAKQNQIDHAIEILQKGLASLGRSGPKEKMGLLGSGTGTADSERLESLRQALKCFDDAAKSSGGRNMMAVLGKARTLYLLGRYADALQSYQEVLSKMPTLTDPDPRIGIGCCLWQLGFKDKAKAAWERSLSLNPESKVANALLGIFYLYQSSQHATNDPEFGVLYKTAMTQYTQKAFKLDSNFPLSCSTFGNYFLLRRAFGTVETLARKAIEQTDVNAIASDGWFLLARKEHNENETQKAADYYNRADQARGGQDKGYWPAKFGAIQLQVALGDFDGAKFRLEKLLQTSKNVEATTLLGCLYAEEAFAAQSSGGREDKTAETRKAIALLETVRKAWKESKTKQDPDESILLYLARLYETVQPAESMKCLLEVEKMQLSQLPEDALPTDLEESSPEFMRLIRQKLPPQLLNNIGCFHYQTEAYETAADFFQVALQACMAADESLDADAYVTTVSYNLGRAWEAIGNFEEAKKVYEGLLQRHADYTEASARLTYIKLRESPSDEGPHAMAKLYDTDSTNVEVRALFGWYLARSKRKTMNIAEDQEQRHFKHTLQYYDKHDKYSLTGMGNIYLLTARDMKRDTDADKEKRRKMYEKAVEFFDKALQLDPRNAYAAQGIAIALIDDKKDFSTAVQILSRVRDTIREASVYINLGHVYSELRQYQRSIENYELALQKDTRAENPNILACLSRVWLLKGKAEKSIPALNSALHYSERALAAAPDQTHLQFNVAFVQFQIAQMINTIPESQRSVEEVKAAADGLEAAIEAFTAISKSKTPPYPRTVMEQRASMGKNTMRKQLERAMQAQKEYESKNHEKLQKAREAREAEHRRKEEERLRLIREQEEKQEQLKQQRAEMLKRTEEMMERMREEERRREELEMTTDEETGERVKRQKKPKATSGGGKRKKRDEGVVSDDDMDALARDSSPSDRSRSATADAQSDGERPHRSKEPRQPKRRKLERKRKSESSKPSKYKSSEMILDSDEDDNDQNNQEDSDEDMGIAPPLRDQDSAESPVTPGGADDEHTAAPASPSPRPIASGDQIMNDDDEEDDVVAARKPQRQRKQLRTIADDDADDDE